MNIKLECHEANHLCDKNQYKETSFWERIKLTIHLLYCRACRKYTARNNKLTRAVKNPKVRSVSAEDKEHLKAKIHQEMSK